MPLLCPKQVEEMLIGAVAATMGLWGKTGLAGGICAEEEEGPASIAVESPLSAEAVAFALEPLRCRGVKAGRARAPPTVGVAAKVKLVGVGFLDSCESEGEAFMSMLAVSLLAL